MDDVRNIPASLAGITEIIAGSYALMDAANLGPMPELRPAARILTTVMTHQDEGLVWLDAGQKATSIDTGLPLVDGIPGATVSRMSAEHGGMVLEEGASWDIDLGSKVWLIPHNIANTVNVYDLHPRHPRRQTRSRLGSSRPRPLRLDIEKSPLPLMSLQAYANEQSSYE